jgi:hypothetical protein
VKIRLSEFSPLIDAFGGGKMKRLLTLAFLAAMLAFSSLSAQAGTISLVSSLFQYTGSHDTVGTDAVPPSDVEVFHKFGSFNSTFKDTFKFAISNISGLLFDVTTTNHVLNMTFALYDKKGNKLFSLSDFQTDAGEKKVTKISFTGFLLDALLAAGPLTLKITGAFCGCAAYNIAVSETPIPPALLLFLTGVGGLGGLGVLRRRKAVLSA